LQNLPTPLVFNASTEGGPWNLLTALELKNIRMIPHQIVRKVCSFV